MTGRHSPSVSDLDKTDVMQQAVHDSGSETGTDVLDIEQVAQEAGGGGGRRESSYAVPNIVVETAGRDDDSVVMVTSGSLKKARTNSDSALYAANRQRRTNSLTADDFAHQMSTSSSPYTAHLRPDLVDSAAHLTFGVTDFDRRYSDPFLHRQQVTVKSEADSTPEPEAMDLSQGGRRQDDEDMGEGEGREDSLLLTKRLKLKRYLHDRYQLGLQSVPVSSRMEVHSDPEMISPSFKEQGRDVDAGESRWLEYRESHGSRVKDIAPLVIKSETGSEPATPSVFPSPTPSMTSYSPVFGSPHSSMDSPGPQGSFFRFHVPPRLPVMSSVHDWMARDGEQPPKLSRFPTVSEYPLMPRFVAQQRMDMLERASTLPFPPSSGSSSKRHLWRPMAASASLHQSESTPSPLTTKTRFLFQPEAFAQHLRLTESPPRSPFSPGSGWTPRSATLPPNYQASAGIPIPSRPFIAQQNISAAASYPPPRHFSQAPVSPRDAMTSFSCPVCHDVLPSYAALADHMVTHVASETKVGAEGSKVYVCKGCKRTFSRSDMLTRHMRLHTGLKPYECAICGQVFSRSDHLHTHLRTHTGEKPYQCSLCSYAAPRRDMITRHMRVHGKRAVGSTRGRSLSSSSCSDGVSPAADVVDIRKHSLSSTESPESSDQSVRGSAVGGSSQAWFGAQPYGSESSDSTHDTKPLLNARIQSANIKSTASGYAVSDSQMRASSDKRRRADKDVSETGDIGFVGSPFMQHFSGSDKDSSSPTTE